MTEEPTVAQLKQRIQALEAALKPFADCVFNDNHDVTIQTGRLKTLDWMRADAALHHFKGSPAKRKP